MAGGPAETGFPQIVLGLYSIPGTTMGHGLHVTKVDNKKKKKKNDNQDERKVLLAGRGAEDETRPCLKQTDQ